MKINWRKRFSIQGFLVSVCLFVSIGCFSQFGYIKTKAYVAQILLNTAWEKTQEQYQIKNQSDIFLKVKPWPWADIFPVGKLTVPRLKVSYIVLNSDSGQALAFGPGLSAVNNKLVSDAYSTQVISGHRDSHFEFLANIVIGDEFVFESTSGQVKNFIVNHSFVIDTRVDQLYFPDNIDNQSLGLVLITCYPFNSATASTPFRLVVEANEFNNNTI